MPDRFLLIGGSGWICGHMQTLLSQQGKEFQATTARLEDLLAMEKVFDDFQPTRVINCAGKTGRPNVDWCETNRAETVRSNVIGTLMLADLCESRGVHLANMATGCEFHTQTTIGLGHSTDVETGIYTSTYTPDRTCITSAPFSEDDPSNFGGSFYSYTKSRVEDILRTTYPTVLTLRIRMPISDDLHPRSFVTKITKYEHVVNIPNSNSILHDLLPLAVAMSEHGERGVYNFTNPGAISHNEVLGLYKELVDPGYEWKNFTLEQQSKVIQAERSNCELDGTKLMGVVKRYQSEGVEVRVPEIREAYRECFGRMAKGMQSRGGAPTEV